jgi:hypothetical protein
VLIAHHHGLSATEALRSVLSNWGLLLGFLVCLGGGIPLGTLLLSHIMKVRGNTTAEVGGKRYNRMRRISTLTALSVVVLVVFIIAHRIGQRLPLGNNEWAWLALAVFLIATTVWHWLAKPSPGRLHVIATGDPSRLIDERVMQVNGRGAYTAVYIFLVALLLGGSFYEMLFRSEWPVRTLVEVGTLFLILICTTWYWNRKL